MHNELFNPIDIFTYHPSVFSPSSTEAAPPRFTVLTRDLFPLDFLDFVWSGKNPNTQQYIKPYAKAIGFKSFPEHWSEVRNDYAFQMGILEDFRVKKIILKREDELAVYVSMLRADQTGSYMTHSYPKELTFRIEPAKFQAFLDNYRNTYEHKYHSPVVGRDTFRITYEQMTEDEEVFRKEILPKLYKFLGVKDSVPFKRLRETTKQAAYEEDLSLVIENYDELEFCFRYSKVKHFQKRREDLVTPTTPTASKGRLKTCIRDLASWTILLPICSRGKNQQVRARHAVPKHEFDTNRFLELSIMSQHTPEASMNSSICWKLLENFVYTLKETSSYEQLALTEMIIGIDQDDPVYQNSLAKERLQAMMPCKVKFVCIMPDLAGKICRIWNILAGHAQNDFLVLLGDDVRLLDQGWQEAIVTLSWHCRGNGIASGCRLCGHERCQFSWFPHLPCTTSMAH